MIYIFLIYILGIIATQWIWYHNLDRGSEITLSDLSIDILMSVFSWVSFFILIMIIYGDKTVFKKK